MNILDFKKDAEQIFALCKRHVSSNETVEGVVRVILEKVREKGDDAVREFCRQFDGVELESFVVTKNEIENAYRNADKKFVKVLTEAAANIRTFHKKQTQKSWYFKTASGSKLGQRVTPIEKTGIYIPGGKAAYPSTVLMNVIPAQVAGVEEIHLVSPPNKNGEVNENVLVAARILGVKNIYRIGGAQAIAALAYGTDSIPKVDKIVGPGNIYVATAKKLVFGIVGIDSFAGPSEVVILADEFANPEFIAADMLAQSEHDEEASSILITTSKKIASSVVSAMSEFILNQPRQTIMQKSLADKSAIILVPNLRDGVDLVDKLAPEHLEIVTKNNWQTMQLVKHAGAIFLGDYSPVAIGDYFAGPNHTLPTSATSRFSSPLGVEDFLKRSSVIDYSKRQLRLSAEKASFFAEQEGLFAHSLSLKIRNKKS